MKKLAIVYAAYETPMEKKAVALLTEFLTDYAQEYPVCVPLSKADALCSEEWRKIYVGTENTLSMDKLHAPEEKEGYVIRVENGDVCILGRDENGMVYGCIDFYNHYLLAMEYPHDGDWFHHPLEWFKWPDYLRRDYPAVQQRGVWTWGHVIYNYRGFIDNMVKLKMNTLIVWNDIAPLNGRDMVDYAHANGVKVIWGYAWMWDVRCAEMDIRHTEEAIPGILEIYEKEYLPLGGDGVYFQSFTELDVPEIDGVLIADAVADFVNHASRAFWAKFPGVELLFGLHAQSVRTRLDCIRRVDERVRIVWEDAGAFPFNYLAGDVNDWENTCRLTDEIASLRGEKEKFGAVTKGLTKLDWSKFQHMEGAVHVGASTKWLQHQRTERKRKIWRYQTAYWLENGPYAQQLVEKMHAAQPQDLLITALIEDGMFDGDIPFAAALYADMLWDVQTPFARRLSQVALRQDVAIGV